MRQDFDFMEILSLKLSQKDAYKIHSSNYGVIIGRVLANDAFGIPNAKISVFIERDDNDTTDMETIYPYEEITGKDKEGRRYNLLPDDSDDECYRIVGTFPNKRLLLDDNTYLEVYDKYWKYSTVTNNAGDYMIFGVPAGNQQIHVDIDMSDIGILSQKPRDYMYKGYTETLFDSSTQFKKSTNLDNLTQIFSQNKSVFVYPFWGDADNGIAAITRADIQINYKFEPTCVFMGSIISDNDGNSINHKCGGSQKSGFNRQLVAGEGTIEMIRKTQDGLVEEYPIQGNRLIDSDGVWCYQIPMNLDFVGTDEYGNIVPTDNPSKGIPTRTQVRFRISKTETGGEGFSNHTAKYLVPMNPILDETKVVPTTKETTGQEMERMYNFGSNTPQSCFRDLYWNNVYSVKNFIPKTQTAKKGYSPYYNALKACNSVDNQNPVPFNKLMINIPFTYMFICLLFTIVITIINVVNKMINLINEFLGLINKLADICLPFIGCPFGFLRIGYVGCIPMQAGTNSDNKVYYPGCNQRGMDAADCPEDMDSCKKVSDKEELMDVIQQNLSQEYDVVRLDLFQDWINGCLYMPLWFWKKTKKKKFLFFTIKEAKNQFCDCDKEYSRLKTKVTCNIKYANSSLKTSRDSVSLNEDKWHKTRDKSIGFKNGLIKRVKNSVGELIYYYTGFQASNNDSSKITNILQRKAPFEIVRLFATDIILLGNLNESNIYGIPQLFNRLPSTSSNIPPIATIEESDTSEEETGKSSNTINDNGDEKGNTVVTGMDWGHSGGDDTPIYKNGLFLDLACLYADTRSKACINVERMSELGVSLDMSYKMTYAKGSDLVEGVIDSDGFINKFEINDNDSRAMFATLNHVGFVPQDYQDEKEMYTTQVNDENTNYLIPKFKYIYPVDFDGRMKPIMEDYENGFAQPLYDNSDESYVTFRLGAEKNSRDRKRHFYYSSGNDDGTEKEMPLYNNSFFFYFGINKGNTAIDKFTSKFIAPCAKDSKKPFTILTETQGKVECKSIYNISGFTVPYIKVSLDDIQIPYSYELLDSSNNTLAVETNKAETEFTIPDAESKITSGIEVTNQTYTIKVTDGNGKKQSERIVVSTPNISINYETEKLGTKFYNTDTTRVDYICSNSTTFYGKIKITSFSVDGYEFKITGATGAGYDDVSNSYIIKINGVNELTIPIYNEGSTEPTNERIFKNSGATIVVLISSTNSSVHGCLCDTENPIAIEQGSEHMIPSWYKYTPSREEIPAFVEIYTYQPNSYLFTIAQICDGVVVDSTSTSEIVSVQNGEVFNAYLNQMPMRFILGTINDNKNGTIMNQSNFYKTSVVTDPKAAGLNGWYGVHQEDTYKFLPTVAKNASIWGDYLTLNNLISSSEAKKKILKYKFEAMFSVAESTYVTSSSSDKYSYRAQGGVGVPLNRSVYPVYDDSLLSTNNGNKQYVLTDRGTINGSENYPNIVAYNYRNKSGNPSGPMFNEFIKSSNDFTKQGNYVAVFSNNGGYISNTVISNEIPVIKHPNYTAVSPKGDVKKLGKDEKGELNKYKLVYSNEGNLPYFRAMFVDRRLDFDFTIFAPATGQKLKLYPYEIIPGTSTEGDEEGDSSIKESPKENIWRNSRISGVTYGGIEMSYDNDDEYNILSAESVPNDSWSAATPNTDLEYSYRYSDDAGEDAITIFNENPTVPRRLYEATLNGADIKDFFWSNGRKNDIWSKISSQGTIEESSNGYYFKYPYSSTTLYNGDFSRNTVSINYPTKRYIDVGNLPAYAGESDLILTSCSYDTRPTIDGNSGELKMSTVPGETIDVQFAFEDFLSMVTPASDNTTVDNITYEGYTKLTNDWYKTTARVIHPVFKLNIYENDSFNVYNRAPRIVKVLPYPDGIHDGISYIKMSCPSPGEGVNKTLDMAIDEVTIHRFGRANSYKRKFKRGNPKMTDTITYEEECGYDDDLILKNGMRVNDRVLFYDGDSHKPLLSNDTAFNIIEFDRELSLDDVSVFTILLQREFESKTNDNLTKHIRTLETSSLFDARPLEFSIDTANTYVTLETVVEEVAPEEGSETQEGQEPQTVSSQTFSQTFGIKFRIDESKVNPMERQNEGFINADLMTYTLVFSNQTIKSIAVFSRVEGEYYQIPAEATYVRGDGTKTTDEKYGILTLVGRWTDEMGIAADKKWMKKNILTVLGKTREGFVYKIKDLNLGCYGFADSSVRYDGNNKTGTGFEPDKPYYINMRFK